MNAGDATGGEWQPPGVRSEQRVCTASTRLMSQKRADGSVENFSKPCSCVAKAAFAHSPGLRLAAVLHIQQDSTLQNAGVVHGSRRKL